MTKLQEQIEHDKERILHVLKSGWQALPIAYPILARHGYMERTAEGFKAIDPESVVRRCREFIQSEAA